MVEFTGVGGMNFFLVVYFMKISWKPQYLGSYIKCVIKFIFDAQLKNAIKYRAVRKKQFDPPHFLETAGTFQNNFKIYPLIII